MVGQIPAAYSTSRRGLDWEARMIDIVIVHTSDSIGAEAASKCARIPRIPPFCRRDWCMPRQAGHGVGRDARLAAPNSHSSGVDRQMQYAPMPGSQLVAGNPFDVGTGVAIM